MEEKKFDVVAEFGVDVFNEETMQQRLPKNVFKALKKNESTVRQQQTYKNLYGKEVTP